MLTVLAALGGAAAISFSAIFFALSGADPATGAFFRAAYALPALGLLYAARRDEDMRPASSRWLAFAAGLALGTDIVLWHTSIELIGAGLATLLANSQVVFVALAAWVIHKERPSRAAATAALVVLLGVALVSGVGQRAAFGDNPILGTGLALLAAMLYATFLLAFRRSNERRAPPSRPLFEATLGATAPALIAGALGPGIEWAPHWPAHGWLLALALGAQTAGWLLIGHALPRLPAVETATIILLQPALTMVWGVLIFGERPSALQVVGAAAVLAGVGTVAAARARAAA